VTKLPHTFTEVDQSAYDLYRLQFGVPQGPEEIQKDSALPLESNTELLNGVHFHKGCYVGQELVARTHYSGLIRKRLFPFVMVSEKNTSNSSSEMDGEYLFSNLIIDNLSLSMPPIGSTLAVGNPSALQGRVSAARDRKTGKVVSGLHNVGLGLIRLESLNLEQLEDTVVRDEGNRPAKILMPCWWHKEVDKIKKHLRSM